MNSFRCLHCQRKVSEEAVGTRNRNHCPNCLWSKHVDEKVAGDRLSECGGGMETVGLTFKQEGVDKDGRAVQGEIMLVHKCQKCAKISINRIAGDDSPQEILTVFEKGLNLESADLFNDSEVFVLKDKDRVVVRKQLFGKKGSVG